MAGKGKTKNDPKTWDGRLRSAMQGVGVLQGFSVSEQSGHCKVTYRRNGKSSSKTLDLEWSQAEELAIQQRIQAIAERMQQFGESLGDAAEALREAALLSLGGGRIEILTGDYRNIGELFMQSRADNRENSEKATRPRIEKAVELMGKKGGPQNGGELMRAYAAEHFGRCQAGGDGRKRHLGDVAAFLTWGIDKGYLDRKWKPLTGDERQVLIGSYAGQAKTTPPLKSSEISMLLDALEASANAADTDKRREDLAGLRMAVALIATCGLRPAELAAIESVVEMKPGLLVPQISDVVKNNKQTKNRKAKVEPAIPIEITGRKDGAIALAMFKSGLVKLPEALRNAIERARANNSYKQVGDCFRQQLERWSPEWNSLVAANEGLTPYSLRHGYAWRGAKEINPPFVARDLARMMRHDVRTHLKYYGAWTDTDDILDRVLKLNEANESAGLISTPMTR